MSARADTGIVVIGRNEGDRLVNCLKSLTSEVELVVYVDSGSTDSSVDHAEELGVKCVCLGDDLPFTAARARNAGFEFILSQPNSPKFVQFVDGDCLLESGYIEKATATLSDEPELALVTGWRAEINPKASIFNEMCDYEWHRPSGDIMACGGDMMVRSSAFEEVSGFNPAVIAAEDDEFCVRLRKAGWRLRRLPIAMTLHDANMFEFNQWWSRATRTGHGFEQVNNIHPDYFVRERRRTWIYGAVLPALGILGILIFLPLFFLVVLIYGYSFFRTMRGLTISGVPKSRAMRYAFFFLLSKFPNLIGALTYRWRKLKGSDMLIIEYK
ncbi:Glycosyltransferase, GT2 family [Ruegeria halocynthiae]|uniref:Glycosyltransferase, GT2 family n=1 Tax=Ruegeria halocynthiae TaxID=985054 RepID=A0A1H2Y1P7_9RHOB|nr:glycosyltransferase family 2 protein [Ruegeria halocynthiae]SDW99056.1 Glycosyltransferase, GT2 family [Ruegeria halocynthiae]